MEAAVRKFNGALSRRAAAVPDAVPRPLEDWRDLFGGQRLRPCFSTRKACGTKGNDHQTASAE